MAGAAAELPRAEEHVLDRAEAGREEEQRPPNLLDFLPDYMPNIALMGKPAGE